MRSVHDPWPLSGHGAAPRLVGVVVFVLAVLAVLGFRAALPGAKAVNENSDFTSFYEPSREISSRAWSRAGGRQPRVAVSARLSVIVAGTFLIGWRIENLRAAGDRSAFGDLGRSGSFVCFRAFQEVWPGRRALLAPALVATYPLLLWLCKQPSSDLPFLALFSAACSRSGVALEAESRYGLALTAGMLTGLSMLVRPIAIGAGFLFASFAWSWGRGSRWHGALIAGILLLGNVLVVLPWEVWAFTQTGRVIPLSTGGVATVRDGLVFAGTRKDWRERKAVPDRRRRVDR